MYYVFEILTSLGIFVLFVAFTTDTENKIADKRLNFYVFIRFNFID